MNWVISILKKKKFKKNDNFISKHIIFNSKKRISLN